MVFDELLSQKIDTRALVALENDAQMRRRLNTYYACLYQQIPASLPSKPWERGSKWRPCTCLLFTVRPVRQPLNSRQACWKFAHVSKWDAILWSTSTLYGWPYFFEPYQVDSVEHFLRVMEPAALRFIVKNTVLNYLVCSSDISRDHIVMLEYFKCFGQGVFGDEILSQIIRDFPGELTDELLIALSSPHLRHLKLTNCSRLSCNGLQKTIAKWVNFSLLHLFSSPSPPIPSQKHKAPRRKKLHWNASYLYCSFTSS